MFILVSSLCVNYRRTSIVRLGQQDLMKIGLDSQMRECMWRIQTGTAFRNVTGVQKCSAAQFAIFPFSGRHNARNRLYWAVPLAGTNAHQRIC